MDKDRREAPAAVAALELLLRAEATSSAHLIKYLRDRRMGGTASRPRRWYDFSPSLSWPTWSCSDSTLKKTADAASYWS